jgi:hypothetical protein
VLCTDITSLAAGTPAASASGTGSAASPPPVSATPSFITGTHF